MDRISHLPDFIVHHILSFLNTPTQLVRMSVLSKTWFHLTASFPFLYFGIHMFTSRECFFNYVEYTTSRFSHLNLPAQKLKLVVRIREPTEIDVVNRCLERILRNGVKELYVSVYYLLDYESAMPKCRMPNILLSVSVLNSLTIRHCDLPSSLMLDAVKFKSLNKLSLSNVQIDDEVIEHLATSCPLLRFIEIRSCPGFKRFSIHGHQHLQEVDISFHTPVERIDIEAPNLTNLKVADLHRSGQPQMNLASCYKLTSVTYKGCPLPNSDGFTHFLSNFPFIENLVLFTNNEGNNLKLSSHSLRTLVLRSDFDLEKLELSTPNLGLFIYSCNELYNDLKIGHLPHLKACMRCYPGDSVGSLWYHTLRLFLDKENGFKASNLYIRIKTDLIVLEEIREIELPPYELDHIELHFEDYDSLDYAVCVDAVLCCFRPRSLTLRTSFSLADFEEQSAVVKHTYEKLLDQEFQGHTNVQIVSPYSSKAQKLFKGLMPLRRPLPREEKAVSFIKEEVVQEAAG